MGIWEEKHREVINSIELIVKERMDKRNHHGAIEYIVEAYSEGNYILSERISWNKWLGHCNGVLIKPLIADKALKYLRQKAQED